jgi:phospholipid N-methyltransferase
MLATAGMNNSLATRKQARSANAATKILKPSGGPTFDFAEHVAFLQSFLREPASVGALSPSSKALARAMIEGFSLKTADTVVELGPGTGAFTAPIRAQIGRHTTFLTMELDPFYARSLKRRFPDLVVYNDSAERMLDYLALHGKKRASYIVSGLPWANLPIDLQVRIMDVILKALSPGGVFTTFAYFHARWLPKAQEFRRSLEKRFARVETSPVIWGNLPPAFVYRCSQATAPSAVRRKRHFFR